MKNFEEYSVVQNIAKNIMQELIHFIKPGVTEREIANEAEVIMRKAGIDKFWYYNIAAFVFVGVRTKLSISGREYDPSEVIVQNSDIVTVDLSPELDGCWGDFARTIIISEGKVVGVDIDDIKKSDVIDSEVYFGMKAEEILHTKFMDYIQPEMTFEEVFEHINKEITKMGFCNLDFLNNLGHTIETEKESRLYFERGNKKRLSEVKFFTFEPHIKKIDGKFGFKREDIYYFIENKVMKL